MKQVYFRGLNGVRFIAALIVFVYHAELFRSYLGLQVFEAGMNSLFSGNLGVTIFFVLSGFLITYLLLEERKQTQTISLKHFYMRRILRIWPLYFLITALAFFVVPFIPVLQLPVYSDGAFTAYGPKLASFVLLLANVAFVEWPTMPFANVLWSVAVEEQFYAFWPLVMKRKPTLKMLGILLLLLVLLKCGSIILAYRVPADWKPAMLKWVELLYRTRFSCMVIGGIGALLYFNRHKWLSALFTRSAQVAALLLFAALVSARLVLHSNAYIFWVMDECISFTVMVLILNIACNPNTFINLEHRWLQYMGKISYGLYVYHSFMIVLTINLLKYLPVTAGGVVYTIALYLLSFALTVWVSALSYRYFESFFLKKKQQYTSLLTGDAVPETNNTH